MSTELQEVIHSYITDMLALEEHIEKALQAQVSAHEEDHPLAAKEVGEMQRTVEGHIAALRALEDDIDAGGAQALGEALKRAGSILAGFGAAAIDLVRNERLPKNLRDDATAFSLAATGYLMLYTTAQGLGHAATATVAERHLRDYAQMIMRINHLVPGAVLAELASEELAVDPAAGAQALEAYRRAWSS